MNTRLRLTETFMLHFHELKSASNSSPKTLISFFRDKPNLRDLAAEVKRSADLIEYVGELRKVHPQVPEQFIRDWKDYLYNWKKQVEFISIEPLLSINLLDAEDFEPTTFEEFARQRTGSARTGPDPNEEEDFDAAKHDGGLAIQDMMMLADHELDSCRQMEEDQIYYRMANTWAIGIKAMEYFEESIGLEIGPAFQRWNKVPAIFVPKHVSDAHGIAESGSLFELLNDAVRAYVAGAPAAAVAMCRAALEMVLRVHYLPDETDKHDSLHDVINLAVARYDFLDAKKLHQLRMDANGILHDYLGNKKLTDEDEETLLRFIKDVKFYIEKAPID